MSRLSMVFGVDEIDAAADFIKTGGVLAYPSESVWGVGCDAFNQQTIEEIFLLKSRPAYKGLIVLTDSVDGVAPLLADLPINLQNQLLDKLWQLHHHFDVSLAEQATTYLMPIAKSVRLPTALTGGFDSLAVRITHHPVLNSLCQKIKNPQNPYGFLVSTSCNTAAHPPATSLAQAQAYFGNKISYLDAQDLGFSKPSQIIDLLTDKILR